MKSSFRHVCYLMVVLLMPSLVFAQGVPKAYELDAYRGKVNGHTVILMLANGYIAASTLKIYTINSRKPVVFEPANWDEDKNDRLKFVTQQQGTHGYFVLYNMQSGYEDVPDWISGKFYSDRKIIPVKLRLVKRPKRKWM
jgi:hypothetical protein